jgi:tripartite-type tricarboxylate transporter receptor subunit TctC
MRIRLHRKRVISFGALLTFTLLCLGYPPAIYANTHEFYSGKTIRLVVGYAPGGGYDLYARTIARHMGKHIAGNPTFVVENMPGAGSLVSANHLYKIAKPDGLTIGHFNGNLFQLQAMGQKEVDFNAARFEYVGAVARVEIACGLSKTSGIDSADKWLASKVAPRMGATAPGTGAYDTSRLLNSTLNFPLQLVLGYKSTGEMRVAVERGELHGVCTGWESLRSLWKNFIESGELVIVLQALPKPHMELPKVPLAINFAKTEEARQLIQIGVHDVSAASRPFYAFSRHAEGPRAAPTQGVYRDDERSIISRRCRAHQPGHRAAYRRGAGENRSWIAQDKSGHAGEAETDPRAAIRKKVGAQHAVPPTIALVAYALLNNFSRALITQRT